MSECPAERCSSAKLAGRWNIPARTLRDIFQKANLESKNGGYDPNEAADAVIEYFKSAYERFDMDAARDRARKSKAEADNVEIENAEKRHEIRRRLELAVKELAVETRKQVGAASYIDEEHRKRLTKELAEIRIKL